MRSVVVYPAVDRAQAVALLDDLAQQREPYHVAGCLHVDVVDDGEDVPLFLEWEPEDVKALTRVVGHQPTWCIMIHMSWTVQAPAAARWLTLALLYKGGAAIDDYSFGDDSFQIWTAREIDQDRAVMGGRRFCFPGN